METAWMTRDLAEACEQVVARGDRATLLIRPETPATRGRGPLYLVGVRNEHPETDLAPPWEGDGPAGAFSDPEPMPAAAIGPAELPLGSALEKRGRGRAGIGAAGRGGGAGRGGAC